MHVFGLEAGVPGKNVQTPHRKMLTCRVFESGIWSPYLLWSDSSLYWRDKPPLDMVRIIPDSYMCKGRHLTLLTHWPTCQPVYYLQSVPFLSAESASCGSWKLWIAQPLVQLELCIEKCPPFHSHLHLLLICWKRLFRSLEGFSKPKL